MPATQFDRDALARWYAHEHLKTDPGIADIYYLPTNSEEREIRLVEVNDMLAERNDASLEPIDLGVNMRWDWAHQLLVLDLTKEQWSRIVSRQLALPGNWTIDGYMHFQDE
ncbi:MAG: hypothetical protein KDA59_07850 [Planctomycetales bacterium]|nr:hypothetical protein [Planctomycetales bacterium]